MDGGLKKAWLWGERERFRQLSPFALLQRLLQVFAVVTLGAFIVTVAAAFSLQYTSQVKQTRGREPLMFAQIGQDIDQRVILQKESCFRGHTGANGWRLSETNRIVAKLDDAVGTVVAMHALLLLLSLPKFIANTLRILLGVLLKADEEGSCRKTHLLCTAQHFFFFFLGVRF